MTREGRKTENRNKQTWQTGAETTTKSKHTNTQGRMRPKGKTKTIQHPFVTSKGGRDPQGTQKGDSSKKAG